MNIKIKTGLIISIIGFLYGLYSFLIKILILDFKAKEELSNSGFGFFNQGMFSFDVFSIVMIIFMILPSIIMATMGFGLGFLIGFIIEKIKN